MNKIKRLIITEIPVLLKSSCPKTLLKKISLGNANGIIVNIGMIKVGILSKLIAVKIPPMNVVLVIKFSILYFWKSF